MGSIGLTDHLARMVTVIEVYLRKHDHAPSVEEIRVAMNMASKDHVHRDLGKLEQTILDVQTRKHALEAQLSGHPAADKIAELGRELAQVDASLNTHEEQWLLLSEEIEAAGG